MKTIIYSLVLIVSMALFSCEENTKETLNITGDVDIHSFIINGVEGQINPKNSTISVILPSGTPLQGIAPQIIIDADAKISPSSEELVDFADNNGNLLTVTYTVLNQDLYQKYDVTVDVAKAVVTSFKIGSVEGIIDDRNKKITIYLPENTDVTSLVPVLEYTEGALLSPESSSAVDFTNPVNYSLNYLGSSFVYEVTVMLGEAPRPVVTIYNGEDVAPSWASIASSLNNGYGNPTTDGINTSSTCISIMRIKAASDDGGRAWSGGALWQANKVSIDPVLYSKFTLMVLKETAGNVQLEIQSDGETDKDWLKASYSEDALGQWQELTFEIPESRTAIINNILVAIHEVDTSNDPSFSAHMMYWDELRVHPKE